MYQHFTFLGTILEAETAITDNNENVAGVSSTSGENLYRQVGEM